MKAETIKKKIRIATWNVNSLRVRLPHVLDWLMHSQPDILALQETKIPDPDFPVAAIQEAGYEIVFSGQRTYNGMSILSKQKGVEVLTDFPDFDDPQRRVLCLTVGGIRIINLYVPNGESVTSAKYQYKLLWLKTLILFLKQELKKHSQIIILGDFNIAPEEIDVHDPKAWVGQVLFSEAERALFREILQLGFVDCFRLHAPHEKAFSWWDYRLNSFKRNLGLRIDHILSSSALASHCVAAYIDKTLRALERPSDHAPVVAEFEF